MTHTIAIGIAFVLSLFVMLPLTFASRNKGYSYPPYWKTFAVMVGSVIALYFLGYFLFLFLNPITLLLHTKQSDTDGAMGMGIMLGTFMGAFIAVGYRDHKKTPRYDQKQRFGVSDMTPLADIVKLMKEVFPDVPAEKIGITSDREKRDSVFFFVRDESNFIDHGNRFGGKLYPYHSLSQATRKAELKDPELKKSRLFWSNGELCLSIDK